MKISVEKNTPVCCKRFHFHLCNANRLLRVKNIMCSLIRVIRMLFTKKQRKFKKEERKTTYKTQKIWVHVHVHMRWRKKKKNRRKQIAWCARGIFYKYIKRLQWSKSIQYRSGNAVSKKSKQSVSFFCLLSKTCFCSFCGSNSKCALKYGSIPQRSTILFWKVFPGQVRIRVNLYHSKK